jgi:hypothetical protein
MKRPAAREQDQIVGRALLDEQRRHVDLERRHQTMQGRQRKPCLVVLDLRWETLGAAHLICQVSQADAACQVRVLERRADIDCLQSRDGAKPAHLVLLRDLILINFFAVIINPGY